MERKNHYISLGVTVFLTAAAILLFYDTFFGGKGLLALLEKAETMEDILSLETTPLGQRMTVGFQASLRKFSQSLQNFLI